MSFRSTIVPLLLISVAAGCDRQDSVSGQANVTAPGNIGEAAEGGKDRVIEEKIGTLDRSHKGEAAPDLPFTGPDGAKTNVAAFAGKPVLLNLWATWCVPCIAEMPTLDKVAGRMRVIAVSQDLDGTKVAPFFARTGVKNLVPYLDPEVTLSTAYQASLPTSILYDSNGREVWRMVGGMDWTSQAATELLAEAK